MNNYSYSQIKNILFEEADLTEEEVNLSLALDMMHELVRRKRNEGDYNSYKIAKFVASLYNNVDCDELYDEWEEEERIEHEDDYPPNNKPEPAPDYDDEYDDDEYDDDEYDDDEYDDISLDEESFMGRYKTALEMLDDLIQKNLSDDGQIHQTVEFYAQKVAKTIPMINPKKLAQKYVRFYNPVFESILFEKLDPKDDVSVWIKDFQESTAPQFKGKSKEKRKEMAIAAWSSARKEKGLDESLSDEEFDKTLANLLDTRLGDDLLDAIEKHDKKGIERIIDVEIDNKQKAKEMVKRILE